MPEAPPVTMATGWVDAMVLCALGFPWGFGMRFEGAGRGEGLVVVCVTSIDCLGSQECKRKSEGESGIE